MNILLKPTEDHIALVKAMASKNRVTALEAQAAVADLMGPVVNQIVNNAPTLSNMFTPLTFGEDDNPSIPVDLYHDITDEDFIRIYSQTMAGGLPYSQMFPAHDELKFTTYPLDTAIAFDARYARKSRLDVVGKTFTRVGQEVLLKQEKTSVNMLCTALVTAETNYGSGIAAGNHIMDADTVDQFKMIDFNNLILRSKRINSSFSKGTPTSGIRVGVTDLIVSPEMIAELRSMAYNPVHTKAVPNEDESTVIPAHESLREQLFTGGGIPEIFGIGMIEILEMGVNQRYNKIFAAVNAANSSPVTFTQADDEILFGIDRGRNSLYRPAVIEDGSETEMTLQPDDQFVARQKKIGFWGGINEARICLEDRALTGLIV